LRSFGGVPFTTAKNQKVEMLWKRWASAKLKNIAALIVNSVQDNVSSLEDHEDRGGAGEDLLPERERVPREAADEKHGRRPRPHTRVGMKDFLPDGTVAKDN
jgi:hypothetical protein